MNAEDRPAALAADDHAVLYGAGFFETFRTREGRPVRLSAHLARLRAACDRLGVRLPADALAASDDAGRWAAAAVRLLAQAGLEDGVCRLTVAAGPCAGPPGASDYTAPTEWLTVRPPPPVAPEAGVTLHLLDTVRDTGEWRPRPKSLNYLNSLLAARELAPRRRHPADEGLLCDARGRVAEAVFSNVFWVREDGVVETPHEDTGALPGVGRAAVLSGLRRAGIAVCEVTVAPEALARARCAYLVSSVRGVVAVGSLAGRDGRPVAHYAPDAAWAARFAGALDGAGQPSTTAK